MIRKSQEPMVNALMLYVGGEEGRSDVPSVSHEEGLERDHDVCG